MSISFNDSQKFAATLFLNNRVNDDISPLKGKEREQAIQGLITMVCSMYGEDARDFATKKISELLANKKVEEIKMSPVSDMTTQANKVEKAKMVVRESGTQEDKMVKNVAGLETAKNLTEEEMKREVRNFLKDFYKKVIYNSGKNFEEAAPS